MSNIITIDLLYQYDYTVKVINALKQYWITQNSFSCIGSPKEKNMLLYLYKCKAKYTLKNGDIYYAESGDIIYTPINCEYTVEFYDFERNTQNTIGINFFLFDKHGAPFVLKDSILIFRTPKPKYYYLLFSKLANLSMSAVQSPAKFKSIFYEIFSELSNYYRYKQLNSQKFQIISNGIVYMEENAEQNLSIKEIAKLCNVSEIYFRKLFKQYAGVSPIEYKLNTKIEKAKQHLKYEAMTIQEISELCGFSDPAYFCKQFKSKTGMTPSEYKKNL